MSDVDYAKLKARLKAAGHTQRQLADYLGVGHAEVSDYLRGKHKMRADRYLKIEAFLAEAERTITKRGVAESVPAPFAHMLPPRRSVTLEEARALKANPPPKLPLEERERIIRELLELGDAYRALPTASARSEDDILGYGDDGLPTQ